MLKLFFLSEMLHTEDLVYYEKKTKIGKQRIIENGNEKTSSVT